MTAIANTRDELLRALAELPVEDLEAVRQFVDFLRYKAQTHERKIVQLGGLWKDLPPITDEDIKRLRREMWGNFGEREI